MLPLPEQNGSRIYVPVSGASKTTSTNNGTADDSMQLDETKDKVYIYNLDDQIAEIEDEENMIFLPDIEKKLREIPQYLLTGDLRPTAENQMVLYGVPASLSVPKERDNVRKAMIESRARAREKQLLDVDAAKARNDPVRAELGRMDGQRAGNGIQKSKLEEDEDAMDLG